MCYSTKHLDFTKIIAIDADEGYLNTGTGNWELMFKQLRDLNRGLTDIILDSPKLRAFSYVYIYFANHCSMMGTNCEIATGV